MTAPDTQLASTYQDILGDFLKTQSEESLYHASMLSKRFVEQGIGPEEIVALHSEAIEELLKGVPFMERVRVMGNSLQFLLEVMITYGVRYKEYLDLRMTETTRAIQLQMEVERIRADEAIRLEQARAEERIRAQQDAMKGKEDFLAFIAHELRTPITVIKGSIEYALYRARQEGSERVQKALGNTEKGLERLLHLSDELLALSREEQTDIRLTAEAVNMDSLIAHAVEEKTLVAQERGLTLYYQPQVPVPMVLGDREWLVAVLDNLIGNAIKYTEAGSITVKTTTQPRRLQIDVIDTGIGIPSDALPYIFEKYYRVRNEGGGFVRGTGLGLALVKRIVERHGGDVRVQSRVGEGSTFTVYLPLSAPPNQASGSH
jgi:signal transduction histidine kinase